MTPNHVKQKIASGTPSIGSWLNLGSPTSAETIAALGFDWLCVDMEHGSCGLTPSTEPIDGEFEAMMQRLLLSARRHGVAPGIHCATPEYANRRVAEGWTLCGIVNDLRFMTAPAKAARDAITA